MARTKALGGWLQESKGREKQRRVSETYKEKERIDAEIILWRARGVLWVMTLGLALVGNATGGCVDMCSACLLPSGRCVRLSNFVGVGATSPHCRINIVAVDCVGSYLFILSKSSEARP